MRYALIYSTILIVAFSSCTQNNNLKSRLGKYAKTNNCQVDGCLFYMRDITWFEWDKMVFSESEEGFFCNFLKNGRIVYKYQKINSLNRPSDIEFGFGNLSLKDTYTYDNCEFRLKVEEKNDLFHSKVYFILPSE